MLFFEQKIAFFESIFVAIFSSFGKSHTRSCQNKRRDVRRTERKITLFSICQSIKFCVLWLYLQGYLFLILHLWKLGRRGCSQMQNFHEGNRFNFISLLQNSNIISISFSLECAYSLQITSGHWKTRSNLSHKAGAQCRSAYFYIQIQK